jgi:hypothetical protein
VSIYRGQTHGFPGGAQLGMDVLRTVEVLRLIHDAEHRLTLTCRAHDPSWAISMIQFCQSSAPSPEPAPTEESPAATTFAP